MNFFFILAAVVNAVAIAVAVVMVRRADKPQWAANLIFQIEHGFFRRDAGFWRRVSRLELKMLLIGLVLPRATCAELKDAVWRFYYDGRTAPRTRAQAEEDIRDLTRRVRPVGRLEAYYLQLACQQWQAEYSILGEMVF